MNRAVFDRLCQDYYYRQEDIAPEIEGMDADEVLRCIRTNSLLVAAMLTAARPEPQNQAAFAARVLWAVENKTDWDKIISYGHLFNGSPVIASAYLRLLSAFYEDGQDWVTIWRCYDVVDGHLKTLPPETAAEVIKNTPVYDERVIEEILRSLLGRGDYKLISALQLLFPEFKFNDSGDYKIFNNSHDFISAVLRLLGANLTEISSWIHQDEEKKGAFDEIAKKHGRGYILKSNNPLKFARLVALFFKTYNVRIWLASINDQPVLGIGRKWQEDGWLEEIYFCHLYM